MSMHHNLSPIGGSQAPPIKPYETPKLAEWLETIEKTKIPRTACSKLIMNYLVTEGFKDAAEKFSKESGEPLTGQKILCSLEQRIKIRDAIQSGHILEAKTYIEELHPSMLRDDEHMMFKLQQQHLIELIKAKRVDEVLKYAQEDLSGLVQKNQVYLPDLERTLALLAFDNPSTSPFGDLLQVTQRQKVASDVNAAILEQDGADTTMSSLVIALHMLLWAEDQLDNKKVKYPKMTDLAEATISAPK